MKLETWNLEPDTVNFILYPILFAILMLAEIVYFRVADKYNIIDKPNERSSHTSVTLRGGGVIFVLPPLLFFAFAGWEYIWFSLGLVMVAVISFVDDIKSLSGRIRFLVHLIGVSLMFWQLELFNEQWWLIAASYILVIGTINAYNFMDGINGITGTYSLVVLIALLATNAYYPFIQDDFIIYSVMGVLVFLFFNFRKKAICFAGDVGSVSMAFIVLFLLIKLMLFTGDLKYILFLAVYGVDSVLTIVHRIILKENIFVAHRLHLYQYLVNKLKWSHLAVSTLYAVVQGVINICVIYLNTQALLLAVAVFIPLGIIYIVTKSMIIKGMLKPVQ